ncbi:hypothetical protein EIP86_007301 [Pleurotus ostreatoroseus]|nr:hypothetical protein EIP86_007301 [Pleurotus ostreatoroseus]
MARIDSIQVELPPDIHPLPDSVTEYFAYPFTLEPHVLTVESARRASLAAHASRRAALLRAREDEKERRKREALRRIAPGFEPQSTPLVPTRRETGAQLQSAGTPGSSGVGTGTGGATPDAASPEDRSRSVMEDLVDQLAALESRTSS